MSPKSTLESWDDQAAAVQKTPNRVTLESMEAKVRQIEYFCPTIAPQMTVACVLLENGYVLTGKSAPADSANFNADLGKKFAREDAMRQMWALEGYSLRERLSK